MAAGGWPMLWRRIKAARMATRLHPAVATLAAAEFLDRFEKIFLPEIGPEFRRDIHLGVGELPEKEIRNSHLARGADEQIGIGIVAGVKMLAEHLDVDHGRGRCVPAQSLERGS